MEQSYRETHLTMLQRQGEMAHEERGRRLALEERDIALKERSATLEERRIALEEKTYELAVRRADLDVKLAEERTLMLRLELEKLRRP